MDKSCYNIKIALTVISTSLHIYCLNMMHFQNNSNNSALKTLLCLGICLALVNSYSGSMASEVAVIRVKYRWASEMLTVVQSILSSDGTVTVSQRINSLVIVDNPEAIQRVRNYLDQFDKPLEQVRIHVRYYEKKAESDRTASARAKVTNDNLRITVGGRKKQDGLDISTESRQLDQTSVTEFFVFGTSGQPAFIRAGKKIPYQGRWPDYNRQYSGGGSMVMFQNVETGFEVTPTLAGDLVHLKIVPRIAYSEGDEAVVRFFGAQTQVTTTIGRWVEIGGTDSRSNDVIREILSHGIVDKRRSLIMYLMVEKP